MKDEGWARTDGCERCLGGLKTTSWLWTLDLLRAWETVEGGGERLSRSRRALVMDLGPVRGDDVASRIKNSPDLLGCGGYGRLSPIKR